MWVILPIALQLLLWFAGARSYTDRSLAREGGEGFLIFLVWIPFWILTTSLAIFAWHRGGFGWIPLHSAPRLLLLFVVIALAIAAFSLYATPGLPNLSNLYFVAILPLLIAVVIDLAFLPAPADPVARHLARAGFVTAILIPALAVVIPPAAACLRALPGEMARAAAEERQRVAAADQESAAKIAALMALPLDCLFEQMWEFASGFQSETVNNAAFRRIAERPTIEQDLAKMLREGNSSGPFFIAYHLPAPTAGLASAMNDYLRGATKSLQQSSADGAALFARDLPGFESALLAARAVRNAGGNLDEGLQAWQQTLESLPTSTARDRLLRQLQTIR